MARPEADRRQPLMIKELPADERPREKMKERGAQALGNSELLAILLRTGTAAESALRLAENLLDRAGGLAGLGHATLEEVEQVRGIGEAKAVIARADGFVRRPFPRLRKIPAEKGCRPTWPLPTQNPAI